MNKKLGKTDPSEEKKTRTGIRSEAELEEAVKKTEGWTLTGEVDIN